MVPDNRFFPPAGPFSLDQLAQLSGAAVNGSADQGRAYENVAPLDSAGPAEVSFLDNSAYVGQFEETGAGCCIVSAEHVSAAPPGTEVLVADNPYLAYARVAGAFHPNWDEFYCPADEGDRVHPTASIGDGTRIGTGVVVGPGAKIGRNCTIAPNAYIGHAVRIGDDCRIGASVSIRYSEIGNDVSIYAGVRIGEPGFGFAASPMGAVSVPQVGRVLVGDGVEIGANTTIDRGAAPDTVIGDGTRIDNLVQIGHNVRIGRMCIIVAQVGIAGSTKIGDGVQIGGQAGIAGHLDIGDGVRIAACSGIMRDIESGSTVAGIPAVPVKQYFRQIAALSRLVKRKGS